MSRPALLLMIANDLEISATIYEVKSIDGSSMFGIAIMTQPMAIIFSPPEYPPS